MAQIRPEQIKLTEGTLLVGVQENGIDVAKALPLNESGNVSFAVVENALQLSVDAGGITETEIQDGAITSSKLATGAIGASAIENGSITYAKLNTNETFSFDTENNEDGRPIIAIYGTPSSDYDAVNKAYVDSVATGLDFKQSVILVIDANIDLSQAFANPDPILIDSYGDQYRLLLLGQTDPIENGIYQVTSNIGGNISIDRAIDANTSDNFTTGAFVYVEAGDYQGAGYVLQSNVDGTSPILGQDDINFVQFNGATSLTAGAGITKPSTNEIAVKVDENSSGLYFLQDNSLALHLNSSALYINSNGLTVNTSGAGIQIGQDGIELIVDGSSVIVNGNDELQSAIMHSDTLSGSLTSSSGNTGFTVAKDPVAGGKILLFINGIVQRLGNGTSIGCDAHFQRGASVLLLSQVVAGDQLYWNNGTAGFVLENSDYIDLVYQTNDY